MNIINVKSDCLSNLGNTGVGACWNDLGIILYAMEAPLGVPIPATTVQAFQTAVAAAILNDNKNLRIRPIGGITKIERSGGEPITFTEETTQNEIVSGFSFVKLILSYRKGGLCLSNALQTGNSTNNGWLFADDKATVWAAASDVADSVEAIPATFSALPAIPPTQPSEVAQYRFQLNIDPFYMNKGIALIDTKPIGGKRYLDSLNGLLDVTLSFPAARALGVIKVKAKTSCGTVDLYDQFADELAVIGAWSFKNADTGADVAILSAAKDTVNNGWTVTLTPNTYALAGYLSLAGPTELDALDVSGYESFPILSPAP